MFPVDKLELQKKIEGKKASIFNENNLRKIFLMVLTK